MGLEKEVNGFFNISLQNQQIGGCYGCKMENDDGMCRPCGRHGAVGLFEESH
jgi:hypothetical protein